MKTVKHEEDIAGPGNAAYDAGYLAGLERAAEIAANKYTFTGSMTVERNVAEKLCARIATTIRAEMEPKTNG